VYKILKCIGTHSPVIAVVYFTQVQLEGHCTLSCGKQGNTCTNVNAIH